MLLSNIHNYIFYLLLTKKIRSLYLINTILLFHFYKLGIIILMNNLVIYKNCKLLIAIPQLKLTSET